MNPVKDKGGFTLIELMLAMTFVSMLLLGVAVVTIQIGSTYTRGTTLREVNQAGRSVTLDLQRAIAQSIPFEVSGGPTVTKYVSLPGGGRLCVGRYTYAWNYGKALEGGSGAPVKANVFSTAGVNPRFVKVDDPNGALCTVAATASIDRANATELLQVGDRELVLHQFRIARTAYDSSTLQALYDISLTIGTNDQDQLTTTSDTCRPPSDQVGKEDYCAVNRFDMIARAGNRLGGN